MFGTGRSKSEWGALGHMVRWVAALTFFGHSQSDDSLTIARDPMRLGPAWRAPPGLANQMEERPGTAGGEDSSSTRLQRRSQPMPV